MGLRDHLKVKYLLLKLLLSPVGFLMGLVLGKFILEGGGYFRVGENLLIIFALLFVGGSLGWFLMPIENKVLWNRRNEDIKAKEYIDKKYSFSPITFFVIFGMLLEIKFHIV